MCSMIRSFHSLSVEPLLFAFKAIVTIKVNAGHLKIELAQLASNIEAAGPTTSRDARESEPAAHRSNISSPLIP